MTIALCTLLFFAMSNASEFPDNAETIDYFPIIEKVVKTEPRDKHVMYVNMLFFQLKKNVSFDSNALKGLERELKHTSDRKFKKIYGVDSKYRHWMLDGITEMSAYSKIVDSEINSLAMDMDDAGLVLGESVDNMPSFKLLYIIKYLSSGMKRTLIERPNRKSITTAQLLVILQAEQNSRANS